jgi:hypothetical protein
VLEVNCSRMLPGVWGIPRNSFSPPKIGGKGVEGSHSRIFLRCITQNSVSSVENKHDG